MARAKRHYIPGQVWHITHRCHQREFLLKFAKDKRRWIQWLFESKRRCGLSILNFVVTSNHIHLLVVDDGVYETIPKSSASAGRQVRETPEEYELREETSPYDFNLGSKKEDICLENMCFWSTLDMISGYYGGPTPQRQKIFFLSVP